MATYTSNGQFPGKKLKGNERFRKLYHYTSFNTFVKIWCTKKLKFGILKGVNDILETNVKSQTPYLRQLPIMFAYQEIRNSYKQISFTMDYDSYLKGCMSPFMWGIYGDKRNGVCIEFDYDKLNIPENCFGDVVEYRTAVNGIVSIPSHIETIRDIKNFIKEKSEEMFFTKQESWQGENEFRLISDTMDYLDISSAISSVYLTSCDSVECLCVEALVKDECEVKFVHYIKNPNGIELIPVERNCKEEREKKEKAINLPSNVFNILSNQAMEFYNSKKADENESLILPQYFFPKNKDD